MRKIYLYTIAFLLLSNLLYGSDYDVISRIDISNVTNSNGKQQISFPELEITYDGNFILCENYNDEIIVCLLDNNFKKKNTIVLSKKDHQIRSPKVTVFSDGQVLVQGFIKNPTYVDKESNTSEPFYLLHAILLDRKLKKINNFSVKRMGFILPKITNNTDFFYFLGNDIHLIRRPSLTNKYVIKTDLLGQIDESLISKSTINNGILINAIDFNTFTIYKNEYIGFSINDLLQQKVDNKLFTDMKLPIHFGIYTLNPVNGKIKLLADIDKSIRSFFRKMTASSPKEPVYDNNICSSLKSWKTIYSSDNKLYFNLLYRFSSKKDEVIDENYFSRYDLTKNKLTTVKMDSQFYCFFFVGVCNDVCYFFNNRNYHIIGIRFNKQ